MKKRYAIAGSLAIHGLAWSMLGRLPIIEPKVSCGVLQMPGAPSILPERVRFLQATLRGFQHSSGIQNPVEISIAGLNNQEGDEGHMAATDCIGTHCTMYVDYQVAARGTEATIQYLEAHELGHVYY